MTLARLTPRVVPPGEETVPVIPRGRSPRIASWILFGLAAMSLFLVLADDRIGFRLTMGALGVTIVTIGIAFLALAGSIQPRLVRVDAEGPGLRFAPATGVTVLMWLVPLVTLLPAIAQLVVDINGLPTMRSGLIVGRGPYLLGVIGVIGVIVQLWGLRRPSGLILTPDGLLGIRGSGDVRLLWEDLATVGVAATPASAPAAKLSLIPRGGARPVRAAPRVLGSDPNQVAAIVRYYLERPTERHLLADGGVAAVRRVEDALSARTR